MPRSSLMRVLNEIHGRPWAILGEELANIAAIVDRAINQEQQLEAVAARLGRPLDNSGNGVELRNGVAILGIDGPIYRYANLFTAVSGATSIETLSFDFQRAVENNAVEQILLVVNSPGGQIDGVQELADMIRAGAGVKPVTAYVDGLAASAAYWLAAAATRVVAAETGLLGSVGVVASVLDKRGAMEKAGVKQYEIVSSRAPFKRTDVATDEGRAQLQDLVDSLEAVMIDRLAAFRNTTPDAVAANYGQGRTMIASKAVAAGMADEITTFEPLVARLAVNYTPRALFANSQKKEIAMSEPLKPPVAPAPDPPAAPPAAPAGTVATAQPHVFTLDPAVAEKQRITAILALPEATGRDGLARMLALETDLSADMARKILAAAPVTGPTPQAKPVNPLEAAMKEVPNPKVGTGTRPEEETPQAEADRVLAFVPKGRKIG